MSGHARASSTIAPTFFEGVAVALAASVAGSVVYAVLGTAFDGGDVLRLVIALSALGYLVYLFSRCRERSGRVTTLSAWTIAAALLWFMQPSLLFYLLVHIGMIWLVRSLYFYSSVLTSLADLGLSGVALIAALWAAGFAGSLFLAIWCFFLVQALFTAIPDRSPQRSTGTSTRRGNDDRFQQAYRSAESAVRKLVSMQKI